MKSTIILVTLLLSLFSLNAQKRTTTTVLDDNTLMSNCQKQLAIGTATDLVLALYYNKITLSVFFEKFTKFVTSNRSLNKMHPLFF